MKIQQNVPLAPYTTFQIGGPARWFAEITSESELLEALAFAREQSLPIFVLGGGSNLLVAHAGFSGLVLHMALPGLNAEPADDGRVLVRAGAGEQWDDLVSFTVAQNLAGIECLAGIPGTVGAAPVQNIGAYGQEAAECIHSVRAYDLSTQSFVELPAAKCGFAYRHSRFNSTDRNRFLLTRVTLLLTPAAAPSLRYADLRKAFDEHSTPSLQQVAETVRSIRRSKGMLMVDDDMDCRSAGSFFKNPVVTEEHYQRIAAAHSGAVPHYAAGEGRVKLAAAWLIEQAGFPRGLRQGQAAISSKHTLALINAGHASAEDILALAGRITTAVQEKFGVELVREPVLLDDTVQQ